MVPMTRKIILLVTMMLNECCCCCSTLIAKKIVVVVNTTTSTHSHTAKNASESDLARFISATTLLPQKENGILYLSSKEHRDRAQYYNTFANKSDIMPCFSF